MRTPRPANFQQKKLRANIEKNRRAVEAVLADAKAWEAKAKGRLRASKKSPGRPSPKLDSIANVNMAWLTNRKLPEPNLSAQKRRADNVKKMSTDIKNEGNSVKRDLKMMEGLQRELRNLARQLTAGRARPKPSTPAKAPKKPPLPPTANARAARRSNSNGSNSNTNGNASFYNAVENQSKEKVNSNNYWNARNEQYNAMHITPK